jgi:cell division protein FtsB
MRVVNICLIVLLAGLQYRIWVGEGSLAEVWRFNGQIEAQLGRNRETTNRNRQLHAEVLDLKQGLDAVEERARRELGMIGRQEVFYQVLGN